MDLIFNWDIQRFTTSIRQRMTQVQFSHKDDASTIFTQIKLSRASSPLYTRILCYFLSYKVMSYLVILAFAGIHLKLPKVLD